METWEMIKSLVENGRDKKFKDTTGRICYLKKGEIIVEYNRKTSLLDIDEEWELVHEPVDFMTAANSGKRIKPVRFPNNPYEDASHWINVIPLTLDEINGKWYIED